MLNSIKNIVSRNKAETNQNEENVKKRVNHYRNLMLKPNIRGLLEALFEDMDKDAIMMEVKSDQESHPDWTPEMLAEAEINSTAKTFSKVAMAGGISSLIPIYGNITGPMIMVGEIAGLFVFQSRLIVKIAGYFGKDLNGKERFQDVLIGITGASGGASSRLIAASINNVGGKAIEKALGKIAEKVSAKLGEGVSRAIPGVGQVISLIGGSIGAFTNYVAIKAVGEITIRRYGGKTEALEKLDSAVMDVAITMALADGILTAGEKALFQEALSGTCLSEEIQKQKTISLQTGLIPNDLKIDINKGDRIALMEMAINMAMADNKLDGKEKDILYTIGKKCSIKPKMIDAMIVDKLQELAETKVFLAE